MSIVDTPTRPAWTAPPAPPARFRFTPAAAMIIGGLAAIGVGLLLPWMKIIAPFLGSISVSGFDTPDGKWLAGGLAFVLIPLASVNLWPRSYSARWSAETVRWLLATCALLVVIGLSYEWTQLDQTASGPELKGMAQIGVGLYLALAGAVCVFLGALEHDVT